MLAKLYIDILGLGKTSPSAQKLLNYRAPKSAKAVRMFVFCGYTPVVVTGAKYSITVSYIFVHCFCRTPVTLRWLPSRYYRRDVQRKVQWVLKTWTQASTKLPSVTPTKTEQVPSIYPLQYCKASMDSGQTTWSEIILLAVRGRAAIC